MKTDLTASDITNEVIARFTANGWTVWRQGNLTYGRRKNIVTKGVPDIVGFTERALWVACEVKTKRDKFSDDQIKFLRNLQKCGGMAYWATEENGKVVIRNFEGEDGEAQKEHCAFPGCRQSIRRAGYCINHAKLYAEPEEPKKKKPINKVSTKQKEALKEYNKVRKEFLNKNPICAARFLGCQIGATDVHHGKGKIGSLLTDTAHFVSLCRSCHRIVEERPEMAKELGLSKSRLNKS